MYFKGALSHILDELFTYYQVYIKKNFNKRICFVVKGAVDLKHHFFYCTFFVRLLCSFICRHAVYQLSGPVCKSTWRYNPFYSASYLHFMFCD